MNGGRGMGEEDRLEESGSPENSQPFQICQMEVFSDIQSGKEIEWKIGNRKELRKKNARHDMPNESYRMFMVKLPFESQKESYCTIWYPECWSPNPFDSRLRPFIEAEREFVQLQARWFFLPAFRIFRRIRVAGVLGVLESTDWDFLKKSFKFHHSTNLHSTYFHATFSRTLFWITTSPGRWWPWWRCSMLGGGAKSRAGEKWWCVLLIEVARDETH